MAMIESKKIGIIGLGKMGFRMAERLLEKGYCVIATDLNSRLIESIKKKKGIGVNSPEELTKKLSAPRVILISIPAGNGIDNVIKRMIPNLSRGDTLIDSGNSFYKDSRLRAKYLRGKGVYFLDMGVSGGINGARNGACLMIGGDKKAFEKTRDVFEAMSRDCSYKYMGGSGAGHLVKGYHNLIEYGYLQALSEVLSCLYSISKKDGLDLNIRDICEIWNKGSIIESRILKYAEIALIKNPVLDGISGSVFGQTQNEMEELIKIAEDNEVDVPSCRAALKARINSQKKPTFAGKITNAIRTVFGGHKEWENQR